MSTSPASAIDGFADSLVRRRDWLVILLVASVHATSHFFQLVIPSLYVSLGAAFGLDFAQLGLLVSIFYVTSGIGQACSGFVVDRIGARPVLWFGLSCYIVAGCAIGLANGYPVLLGAAFIAGVGNSVFHPADFAIINVRVSQARLGHAFSMHGLTGSVGWALAPLLIATLTEFFDWRIAAFGATAVVALALACTVVWRDLLVVDGTVRAPAIDSARAGPGAAQAGVGRTLMMLLSRPALWGAFLFFASSSIAMSAVQNYTIPLMDTLYGLSHVTASTALSGYMLASAFGMFLGGFLVSATPRAERTVATALIAAGAMLVVLALGWIPSWMAAPFVVLAGLCSGVAGPSRDMLIRSVTPKGTLGSVYGLVYSGMDVGAALGPLCFGLMMDAGMAFGPWLGAAASFVLAAWLATLVGRARPARAA